MTNTKKRASVCDKHATAIRGYVLEGHTLTEAASMIGVHRATLVNYARREGITFQPGTGHGGTPTARSKPTPTGEVSREEILEVQLKELRAAVSKDRRATVAQERIIQAVEQALSTVEPPTVVVAAADSPSSDLYGHHRQLLMLSDFHGGEVVNRQAVNGLNEYDWDIMLARVDEVIESMASFKKYAPQLSGLDVVFIGDMCSGDNHEELARTNAYPLAEQGVKMGYVKANILRRLAPHYQNIRSLSVEGNHPRLVVKPAAKQAHNNMDWVAAIIAKEATQDIENLSMKVGSGSEFWEIAGRLCYVWHGDGIMNNMPGVPWGGVSRRTDQIQSSFPDVRIDHFLFGHYHQSNVVRGGRLLGNGALKGTDEWCQKRFGGGDKPTQLLLTFDEKRSRMTSVDYITPTAGL